MKRHSRDDNPLGPWHAEDLSREFRFSVKRRLYILNSTYEELETGGKNTRYKKIFRRWALPVLTFGVLALQTLTIIKTLPPVKTQAIAAETAAKTGAKQLELSERPWVSANFIVTGPMIIDNEGAHLPMQVILNNVGHSPAVKGADTIKLYASFLEDPDPRKVRQDFCKEVEGISAQPLNASRQFLKTWFPGEQPPTPYRLSINRDEINKAARDRMYAVQIAYCVAYQSSFGNTQYHTGYSLNVFSKQGPAMFGLQNGIIPVALYFDAVAPSPETSP